ncbi:hypothetical protein UFOVP1266_13 [uncultured Caudovirales phage]|uniref:Uncharacterized protein n=1 Tax=uncultured Caudovirales phage TaxID=2100421 RepID=A0A6J5PGX8_9CAUD|nr:hypothetical protein UFOVP876_13 [uncultured Caudovirales phage]CAB4194952.1 hypothetical protein UFOVP1266_13 [uncultured Caudovirales phage]
MATNVYTGRNLTLSINAVAYSAQISSATLTPTQNTTQYITLTGSAAKQEPVTWSLDVTGFQDWATTTGISKNLYDAANTGTPIAFSLVVTAGTAKTITGNVIPIFANIGGDATAALEQTYSFPVDGNITVA